MKEQMGRREFFRVLGAGAAAAALPSLAVGAGGRRRMNVLFIAVDDLRPQLACYGHQQMVSPHMDALADQGVAFTHAYCQQAVCAPSRASLLTGLRPDRTTIYDLQTPVREALPDVLTLPQHFKRHGYATVSLGKVYHHRDDDLPGWSERPWHPHVAGYALEQSRALNEYRRRVSAGQTSGLWGSPTEAGDVGDDAYPDGATAEQAVRTLRQLESGPFFLAVGFYKPHLPFCAPKRYWDLYNADEIDLADNPFKPRDCPDIAMHNWAELRAYYGIPPTGPLSGAMARHLIHGYYACTSYVDALVGRLLAELDGLGLRQETVVVLWGDHGWNLGEHGLWCKHCNFETSVHVPMIFRAPGMAGNGRRSNGLTEFVDIYPTLSDLCGLPLPDHLEGRSLAPLLGDPDAAWNEAAYSQYPRGRVMGYSTRTRRYRYTEWINTYTGQVHGRELYDHDSDPGENVSLALRPEYRDLIAELSRTMHAELKPRVNRGGAER